MSKFLQTGRFKSIDPREFDLNKYSKNNPKSCVLEVNLEYPKELRDLSNYYALAPDEIKVKEKILSKYQVMIADFS